MFVLSKNFSHLAANVSVKALHASGKWLNSAFKQWEKT